MVVGSGPSLRSAPDRFSLDSAMLAKGPRLSLHDITKKFGDFSAVEEVTIELFRGEIHAIVGENGAGKSTLMRVLAGHMAATGGSMILDEAPVAIDRAAPGQRPAVGFLEQEGGLIAELSGAENLILAVANGIWSNRAAASNRLKTLAKQFGGAIDPDVPVLSLTMGQRQRLEILITLARGAEILILDEPTASLSVDDAKTLGQIMRGFAAGGGSVFYISHKLNEVREIADRVTVMRRGKIVGRHAASAVSVEQLAAEMVGELNQAGTSPQVRSKKQAADELVAVALGAREEIHFDGHAEDICALRGVSVTSNYKSECGLSNIDLTIRAGEIVGVAGVVGSGQTVLAETLAGLLKPSSGTVWWADGPIAYVPENRHRDALALPLTVRDNMLVHSHRQPAYSRGPWFRHEAIDRGISGVLEKSRVYGAANGAPVSSLSGGNQQKLVLGRELEQMPRLLIAHNPFRGLDVRAIHDVRDAIFATCKAGLGVVMISSDLDEIVQIAHRIIVLFAGRIAGEVDIANSGPEAIGRLMGGLVHDRLS
jgi:general nucleoside transport system ATP-binding protein